MLDVLQQLALILFVLKETIAASLHDLLAQIPLTKHRVAGDDPPLPERRSEQLQRGIRFVGLVIHRHPTVAAVVEATGARLLFLPQYSSDLNPMWSKVKSWLRTQAARTNVRLLREIGRALAIVTPVDAAG